MISVKDSQQNTGIVLCYLANIYSTTILMSSRVARIIRDSDLVHTYGPMSLFLNFMSISTEVIALACPEETRTMLEQNGKPL